MLHAPRGALCGHLLPLVMQANIQAMEKVKELNAFTSVVAGLAIKASIHSPLVE